LSEELPRRKPTAISIKRNGLLRGAEAAGRSTFRQLQLGNECNDRRYRRLNLHPRVRRRNRRTFQNGTEFPNPHSGFTTIPFTLGTPSGVQVDIYDLSARKVATIQKGNLSTGDYKVDVDFAALGIASGSYIYRLQVSNDAGVFRQMQNDDGSTVMAQIKRQHRDNGIPKGAPIFMPDFFNNITNVHET
jgi:hypothetical protein